MTIALSLHGVEKRFGDVVALDNVNVSLHEGEVLGLIGQNGSGKSSLMKIMSGLYRPDGGEVRVGGKVVQLRSPLDAGRAGIGLVHQEQSLIGSLSVAENLFLDKPAAYARWGSYRWTAMKDEARRQLEKVELDIDPFTPLGDLSFGERQMVELAKVLTLEELVDGHLVILFDEPTAVLNPPEIEALFSQIRRIKHRSSVVFVSHRMDEILDISDRVLVMSDGRNVAEREKDKVNVDELYELMVGKQRIDRVARRPRDAHLGSSRVLEVENMSVPGEVHDVSFSMAPGEILGVIGVQGSGAESVLRTIFGMADRWSGSIRFDGKPLEIDAPSAAVARGIGYLPAERKTEGMVRNTSVSENAAITFGWQHAAGPGMVSRRREKAPIKDWVAKLAIKTPSIEHQIDLLSGGNQQKVVLSKWLLGNSLKLLMLDHPTRGLDPGARADLFAAIRELADKGLAILLVGDTLDEVLSLSDEIIVMKDGMISAHIAQVQQSPPSEEELVRAMV
ncbi:sugar ABC transporter ATP-binding protein [Thalassovita sp.]|uniref:sugar ABC transporter ATP-binding protein n=1 Tax=Thalassovita sp. TaxID=1979401 RepID=UPI002204B22A|nr:sugar ABC transporter ATP-binding protein [Thalassovita sp.]MDF1804212.1 sugar ABC transporter ATP-binding protein [Thalassovita sp.]UWS81609.1 sugar ABC transporter ATP-binding protein [Phaeobacter sp. G2]